MNPRLVRQFIYPWHEALRGRRTFDNLRELEATQWWPAERLREWQQVKLRALFRHAVGHCPYYGEVFAEAGVDPHGREPLSALPALPLLDKDTIRRRRQELTWARRPVGFTKPPPVDPRGTRCCSTSTAAARATTRPPACARTAGSVST